MQRPSFEHRAALAAAGHADAVYSRNYFRMPHMAADVRYALVRNPDQSTHKPSVFISLHSLADSIHRQRGDRPLQMSDEYLTFRGEASPRKGVSVWTLDPLSGDRDSFIGWAWLDGGDRFLLEAAMPRRQGGVSAIRAA